MNHTGNVITSIKVKSLADQKMKIIELIDCEQCGFAHQYPFPTLNELGDFYAYHFYSKQKPDYLLKMDQEANYWLTMYNWRIKNILKHCSATQTNILDVGSSGGFFLEAAKRLGCTISGIEPSTQAAEYCYNKFNISVSTEIYERTNFADGNFNIIHISLVLEHLLNPMHFIEWAYSKLAHEGILVIEVPHEFNAFQNLLINVKNYPHWYFSYPDHINYFSKSQLTNFVCKNNFTLIDSYATYPMESFILQGLDYLNNPDSGTVAHGYRMNFDLNLLLNNKSEVYNKISKSWIDSDIGRTQILFFRKTEK